jgi:hypothetical protein
MIKLSVGERYPFPLSQTEGAAAQFLVKAGNILQIAVPDIDSKEKKALKSGMIKSGMLYEKGALLLLFQFYGDNGKPLLTFDSPFDVRMIPKDLLQLHSITNEFQRLAIEIHAVDNGILKVLRLVTMPPDMTIEFLSAAQEQLTELRSGDNKMQEWLNYQPVQLLEQCEKTYIVGT